LGRIIVPDFIAHGHSSTSPADAYHLKDNIAYFDAFFDALDLTGNVTLVIHDWGAAVGFYRAAQIQGGNKRLDTLRVIRFDGFAANADPARGGIGNRRHFGSLSSGR
jgi:pimeloyl-ACP methyl ester carboxylesterase